MKKGTNDVNNVTADKAAQRNRIADKLLGNELTLRNAMSSRK